MYIQSFRELIVWQKSMLLVREIYLITKLLPKEEMFGLTNQMRRCSVSIPSNIAEGKKRRTKKDYIRFLGIADSSSAELETQILITKDLYPEIDCQKAFNLLKEVQKMLITIINRL